jgi:hypothetical protein
MLDEINMKSRQPLVFAILTDILHQLDDDTYLNVEEFVELLKNNMGNRNT